MEAIYRELHSAPQLKKINTINLICADSLSSNLLSDHFKSSFEKVDCRVITIEKSPTKLSPSDLIILNIAELKESQAKCLIEKLNTVSKQTPVAVINIDREKPVFQLVEWPNIKGLFHSDDTNEVMLKGILAIDEGKFWFPRCYSEHLAQKRIAPVEKHHSDIKLTRREKQIIDLLIKGLSNQEMASELYLSSHTVKTHIYKLYKKINVKNRVQAIQWASSTFSE